MEWAIVIGVIVLVITYIWYTVIIKNRNKALEALSGIDVQLKKRNNLIPNILKIAKRFMKHEKGLMEEITKLRAKSDKTYDNKDMAAIKEHLAATQLLDGKMAQLMVAVEAYPDLKSDQNMLHAQETYNEVEAQIAAARRFYNAAINAFKNSIQIFPGNLIAKLASAEEMPFYEADEESKKPVDASEFLE